MLDGDGQIGLLSKTVNVAPAVLVEDAGGNPVPGETVTFLRHRWRRLGDRHQRRDGPRGHRPGRDVLEFGAGSGALAADLLHGLDGDAAPLGTYWIVEVSPELRDRQRRTLAERVPDLLARVRWLERLPEGFRGVMIGNEVLDAMPVHRFAVADGQVLEGFVQTADDGLAEAWLEPRSPGLVEAVRAVERLVGPLPDGYRSEVNLRLGPWLKAVGAALATGGVLLVDYGYTRADYYHPQRMAGTLLCHYRHRVHADPLRWPGRWTRKI